MTTIRLKLPSNLYRPWKPLYRQRSKKQKDPPVPYTPLEQQLYDHAKIKFDQRINILRSIFAKESQSLSTKSRFAQLQLKAEEQEFKQLITMVKQENERLLTIRRNDERLAVEEEERIRSNILNILSDKEFHRQINIEDEVKQKKLESRSWINPNDLTREIERMLNEKHDYNYSIDLSGIKRTLGGKEIVEQNKPNLVSISPLELEPKNVARKPPDKHKRMSYSNSNKVKHVKNGHQHKKEELSSSDDDGDNESTHAPFQLKIEFINSIMFRQWALAKKLCQFMLMYEPNNNEAKQYAPLIDYMLAQEQQQSSSSSSDDSSDDDDDSERSSSSDSSSSSNEEEKLDDDDDIIIESQAPKPVNASLSHKCTTHHK